MLAISVPTQTDAGIALAVIAAPIVLDSHKKGLADASLTFSNRL